MKPRVSGAERKPHILIVEDSELVSDALRILFVETGHRASVAESVRRAVAAATADPIDVMLLDLIVEDGDGLRAMEELRALGSLPRATLALTGRDDSLSRQRCLDAGCVDVLIKPVPLHDLLVRVRQLLAAGGSAEPQR